MMRESPVVWQMGREDTGPTLESSALKAGKVRLGLCTGCGVQGKRHV